MIDLTKDLSATAAEVKKSCANAITAVLCVLIIAAAIVALMFLLVHNSENAHQKDRDVKVACINHGGTYLAGTCVIPTR